MRVSRASEMEDGTGFPVKGFCTIPGGFWNFEMGPVRIRGLNSALHLASRVFRGFRYPLTGLLHKSAVEPQRTMAAGTVPRRNGGKKLNSHILHIKTSRHALTRLANFSRSRAAGRRTPTAYFYSRLQIRRER